MYYDMKGRAWNYLADDCYSWLKLAGSSLRTNYQRIRRKLHDLIIGNWIKYGDVNEWDRNSARIEKSNDFQDVNLWADSTDYPITGTRSMSRKDLFWSYKCNGAGVRVLTLHDGKGKVKYLSPLYSPKLYDSHWLEMKRDLLEENFPGATIIADTHFSQGRELFTKVNFKTPIPEPRPRKRRIDGAEIPQLNQASANFNAEHRRIRSRVEQPYARIKRTFRILEEPFSEGIVQLESIVAIGCGIINRSQ